MLLLLILHAAPPVPADRHGDPLPRGAVARAGTVRLRHGHVIAGLSFSADGKRLASCASDHTVRVWETGTGRLIACLGGDEASAGVFQQSRWVRAVALSGDGQRVASIAADGELRVRDVDSGKETRPGLNAKSGARLAFSPDGRIIAAAVTDSILLYDLVRGGGPRSLNARGAVMAVSWSPDGKAVAATTAACTAEGWDAKTGAALFAFAGTDGPAQAIAWSPDGKRVAHGAGGRLALHALASGKQLFRTEAPKASIRQVDFINGGKDVLAFWDSGEMAVFAADTGKESRRIKPPFGPASLCAVSPDGKTAALALGAAIRLLDLETGKPLVAPAGHIGHIRRIAFLDGRAFATGSEDGTARAWDAPTGKPGKSAGIEGKGAVVALHGDRAVVRAWGGNAELRQLGGAKPLLVFDVSSEALRCAAFSPDGRRLAVGCARGVFRLLDPTTGKLVREWKGDERCDVSSIAYGEGGVIAAADSDRKMTLWTDAGTKARDLPLTPGSPFHLAFSRDGRYLAAGSTDSVARVWEVATGTKIRELGGLRGYAMSVAFSPDGRFLAVGEWMGTTLFSVAGAGNLGRAEGQDGDVMALAFSPDGKRLVSGSGDGTALAWDVGRAFRTDLARVAAPTDLAEAVRYLEGEPARAVAAVWSMSSAGDKAVDELRKHLRPVAVADLKRVPALTAKLDDEELDERRKAQAALEDMGRAAEKALREAMKKATDPDVKLRLGVILRRLAPGEMGGSELRDSRALQVLELVATPAARKLLEELAKGEPEAPRTRMAKAALERLGAPG
ncbi:MAG: hypothetical protein K2W96_28145 [Gemmataceae bacterium]|nr:hypothetical protein [Gemmataceae bacterium]